MSFYDRLYGEHSEYITHVERENTVSHIGNEKRLFSLLTTYNTEPPGEEVCANAKRLFFLFVLWVEAVQYVLRNEKRLFVNCTDDRPFSHCQQYYLFRYDTRMDRCEPFYRQNCSLLRMEWSVDKHNVGYDGVTVATQISFITSLMLSTRLDRMNRIPYLLQRWKQRISIAVFLDEKELSQLERLLMEYSFPKRIIFSFYIRKTITSVNTPYYRKGNVIQYFNDGLYPMNILRDMAIESVTTTHYLLLDIDTFISSTLEESIERSRGFLNNHFNILVFQVFQYSKSVNQTICRTTGECNYLYWFCLMLILDGMLFHRIKQISLWIWKRTCSIRFNPSIMSFLPLGTYM